MELNLGVEHLGLLFFVTIVVELLKKKGLNVDYAPFVAFLLGWLGAIPLIIWQERAVLGWGVLLSGVFIEGSLVAMVAMGGYDTVKKLLGGDR